MTPAIRHAKAYGRHKGYDEAELSRELLDAQNAPSFRFYHRRGDLKS